MSKIIETTINSFIDLELKTGTKYASYIYMFLSSFLFALMSLFVKYCKYIPPYQVIYTRAFINIILCILVINNKKYQIITKNIETNRLLMIRGILGGLALSLYFHSIYFLPLSIVSVLQRINPLWVGVFGALFYNEPYTFINIITTLMSFIGVIFIMKPDFLFGDTANDSNKSSEYFLGMILALGNSVVQSIIQLTIRALKDRTNVMIVVFYFNFFNSIFAGIGQVFESTKVLSFYDWFLLFLIGVIGWVAQLLRARSLFLEKAFILSIVAYFQIIFSYFFDIFLLDENIDFFSYIGILVIILSMGSLIYAGAKD